MNGGCIARMGFHNEHGEVNMHGNRMNWNRYAKKKKRHERRGRGQRSVTITSKREGNISETTR